MVHEENEMDFFGSIDVSKDQYVRRATEKDQGALKHLMEGGNILYNIRAIGKVLENTPYTPIIERAFEYFSQLAEVEKGKYVGYIRTSLADVIENTLFPSVMEQAKELSNLIRRPIVMKIQEGTRTYSIQV